MNEVTGITMCIPKSMLANWRYDISIHDVIPNFDRNAGKDIVRYRFSRKPDNEIHALNVSFLFHLSGILQGIWRAQNADSRVIVDLSLSQHEFDINQGECSDDNFIKFRKVLDKFSEKYGVNIGTALKHCYISFAKDFYAVYNENAF